VQGTLIVEMTIESDNTLADVVIVLARLVCYHARLSLR
jgi:hypothetical protein